MAICFGLSAEFGDNKEAAEDAARLFRALGARLSRQVHQDEEGAWWCDVVDLDLYQSWNGTDDDFRRLAARLFDTLRAESRFRLAMVGVEVFQRRTFSQMLEENAADRYSVLHDEGVVLSRGLWSQVGQPAGYESFSSSHVYRPIRSEIEW